MIIYFSFLLYVTLRIIYRCFKITCSGSLYYIWILFQENKDDIEAQSYQGEIQNIYYLKMLFHLLEWRLLP